MATHGTRYCYITGCRCPECVAAQRAYQLGVRRAREERRFLDADGCLRAPVAPEMHGKKGTYNHHVCRCLKCCAANTAHQADYAKRRVAA